VDFKTSTAVTGYQLELINISSKINLNENDVWKISNIKLILNLDTSTLSKKCNK
jgi:hypothetical protein